MSNSLYLEAISEAKQLKEAAEANAKKAIIDAMAPQIKRLVERELLEESDDLSSDDFLSEIFGLETTSENTSETDNNFIEIDEDLLESIASTTIDRKRLTSLIESYLSAANLYNSIEEKDSVVYEKFELIASNLLREAKTLRDDVIRIVEGEGTADADSSLLTLDTIIKETNKMSTRSKDEVLYELDLSELDLFEEEEEGDAEDQDADLDLDVDAPEDDEGADDDELEDDEEEGLDEEGEEPVELELDPDDAEALLLALKSALGEETDDAPDEGEVEEYDHTEAYAEADTTRDEWIEIDEGMLRREIAAMRSIAEGDAKKNAKDFGGGKIGGNRKKSPGDDFGGGKRGKDPLTMSDKDLNVHAENKQLRMAYTKETRKNRNLKNKIQGAVTAVTSLQGQLKEMNLFNAKLLYANKLLQNKNISTRQMRSIVESLDNARSLREVKLLYKTMTESFTSKKKSNGSLNESAVRKAVGSSRLTRSASAKNSNTEIDRWATLAGLK